MSKKEYKLKIKTEKDSLTDTYGKFVLQPLERGYGVTVGNALRRVLLTSLPGAAITNVKVDGVLHEFSTIPGVKDDMADMYNQDANDAEVIYNFIVDSNGVNIPTASKYLSRLDTIVREAICMAIAEDKGNDFLVENFGWSVK